MMVIPVLEPVLQLHFYYPKKSIVRLSLYKNICVTRHTRREAGIECHGW
jgi:hypothetical protein